MTPPPLWTSSAIAAAVDGRASACFDVSGIAIDSRNVAPGDLFIALKGPNYDGHAFIADAIAAGAGGVLSHHHALPNADRVIHCQDTRQALKQLGRAGRDRYTGPVIAITGSVGKTSTKEMLAHLLTGCGPVHATRGSLNNHWGMPLTLARLPVNAQAAVIEMGMNHAGELSELTHIARPLLCLVTWVASAHLENFADEAAIAHAKAEIFEGLCEGGVAILPAGNIHYPILLQAVHAAHGVPMRFGTATDCEARLLSARVAAERTHVRAMIDSYDLHYEISAAGRHWAMNSVAALAAASRAVPSLDLGQAAGRLASFSAVSGRGSHFQALLPSSGSALILDESYNANPASVVAALESLAAHVPAARGRRVAILGDMLELGPQAPALHAALAHACASASVDVVYAVGPLMSYLADALCDKPLIKHRHYADSTALGRDLVSLINSGDVVMIKGSLGSRMGHLVNILQSLTV